MNAPLNSTASQNLPLHDTVECLRRLIAYPTVSSESNLNLIHDAANLLEAVGARIELVHDDAGQKANLFASIGPETSGGIVLSGHSDVVPVAGQRWSTDPFELVEKDGVLYGRGTCDMKGFIAACLTMAPQFAALNLTRPLHFCFSYDEEVGCLGAQRLVSQMADWAHKPSVAIIGEPTEMRIIEGHKGCCEYRTSFKGLAGHGSQPAKGVNAIEYAVQYISKLMSLREDLPSMAPRDSRFDPPYTTLQVGKIEGGQAHNIIPWECFVDWEMRPVQPSDGDYIHTHIQAYCNDVLLPAMRAVSPKANISLETIGDVISFQPATENEAREIIESLTGQQDADVVAFGTEAGLFQSLGMSAVVCGPGSITQAHKPDEFITKAELQRCLHMLDQLKAKLAA